LIRKNPIERNYDEEDMMRIPFTIEQFFEVFERYNTAVFPAQFILMMLAITAFILAFKKTVFSDRTVVFILGFLWFWMGAVYHLVFFAPINRAAVLFGIVFIFQGVYFMYRGAIKKQIIFGYKPDVAFFTGVLFILYSLAIYPLIGSHTYPRLPLFGVPCPTTIFTFGILLWARNRIPLTLLIVPFLWSIVGFSAAINLGVVQDYGLFIAGLLGTVLIIIKNRKMIEPHDA
jgi:hypothetical protein